MEENTANAIEVEDLVKQYPGKRAVDKLTFNVPEGTITGFIGPNGAGKTTTLRILATLLPPTSGTVTVCGKRLRKDPREIQHQLGFMPDYFGLYEDMTSTEYLDFFAAAYHIPANKRKKLIDDILELVDLTAKREALVTELSRGMQQRLSLGRALVHDPKLLLLDEPASGLDPRARIELMELLRELRNMGKTIFISSHILAELRTLCDFVVIIENGRLVYHGTVSEAVTTISGGATRVSVILKEGAEKARESLQSVKGIKEIQTQGQILLIEHDPDMDSSGIVQHLVVNGYAVQEVKKEQANLEDVFMSLTKGGIH